MKHTKKRVDHGESTPIAEYDYIGGHVLRRAMRNGVNFGKSGYIVPPCRGFVEGFRMGASYKQCVEIQGA